MPPESSLLNRLKEILLAKYVVIDEAEDIRLPKILPADGYIPPISTSRPTSTGHSLFDDPAGLSPSEFRERAHNILSIAFSCFTER
jgi:hypothetical protein